MRRQTRRRQGHEGVVAHRRRSRRRRRWFCRRRAGSCCRGRCCGRCGDGWHYDGSRVCRGGRVFPQRPDRRMVAGGECKGWAGRGRGGGRRCPLACDGRRRWLRSRQGPGQGPGDPSSQSCGCGCQGRGTSLCRVDVSQRPGAAQRPTQCSADPTVSPRPGAAQRPTQCSADPCRSHCRQDSGIGSL